MATESHHARARRSLPSFRLHSFATPRLSVAVGQQLCIMCGIAKNVTLRALSRKKIRASLLLLEFRLSIQPWHCDV